MNIQPHLYAPFKKAFNFPQVSKKLPEIIMEMYGLRPYLATLKDENWHIQWRAAEALEKMTGKDFGEDEAKWQNWWDKNKDRKLF